MIKTVDRITRWMGKRPLTPAGVEAAYGFIQAAEYLDQHEAELALKYPHQWAAYRKGKLTIGRSMQEALSGHGHLMGRAVREVAVKCLV